MYKMNNNLMEGFFFFFKEKYRDLINLNHCEEGSSSVQISILADNTAFLVNASSKQLPSAPPF